MATTPDSVEKTMTLGEIVLLCKDHCPENSALVTAQIKRWINTVAAEMLVYSPQSWMLAEAVLSTEAEYTEGTVSATKGSLTATFSGATITAEMVGRKLYVPGTRTGYPIATRVSDSEVTLAFPYQGESVSGVEYKILKDTYDLESDFDKPYLIQNQFSNLSLIVMESLPVEFKVSDHPTLGRITVDRKLILYPAPKRVIGIYYLYYRVWAEVTDLTATIPIPDRHVSTLVFGVARNYWLTKAQARGEMGRINQYITLFEKGKAEILNEKYQNPGLQVNWKPYRVVGVSLEDSYDDWTPQSLIEG